MARQTRAKRGEMNFEDQTLTRGEIDRIIMMAWEDRTSFDAIRNQFGLSPGKMPAISLAASEPIHKEVERDGQGKACSHEGVQSVRRNQRRALSGKSQIER